VLNLLSSCLAFLFVVPKFVCWLCLTITLLAVCPAHACLQAFGDAEKLVDGSINFVHAAKNTLLELDAWRLAQGGAGKLWKRQQQQQDADNTADLCDRWVQLQRVHVPVCPSHPFQCLCSGSLIACKRRSCQTNCRANVLPPIYIK
jgi:hypothetical protein